MHPVDANDRLGSKVSTRGSFALKYLLINIPREQGMQKVTINNHTEFSWQDTDVLKFLFGNNLNLTPNQQPLDIIQVQFKKMNVCCYLRCYIIYIILANTTDRAQINDARSSIITVFIHRKQRLFPVRFPYLLHICL